MLDQIIENEGLVYSVISRCHGYCDKEDLYQVGIIGLMNASKKFDPTLGIKFSTYAYKYILGEVTKYMRENSSVKLSRDMIRLKSSIGKTRDILRQKLGREPTTLEVSLLLDVEEEKVKEVEALSTEVQSLDYCTDEDTNNLYNSIRVEQREIDPDILDLKSEVSKLEPDERKLIYSRYYFDLTQGEVSKELGITQVQVSRKESKILEKLKTKL